MGPPDFLSGDLQVYILLSNVDFQNKAKIQNLSERYGGSVEC